MSIIGSNILAGASGNQGYNINNSLRFRSSASAYLNRTPGSAGNRKTWTWSGWVKKSNSAISNFISADPNSGNRATSFYTRSITDGRLEFEYFDGTTTYNLSCAALLRDPSSWYHLVLLVDTTQATNTNRTKIYINGVLQTVSGTYVPQNTDMDINNTSRHNLGRFQNASAGAGNYLDGYLAEVNFIDGQALTPSSFGETDTTTGSWKPKAYTGTYGTNGFYLKFSDIAQTVSSNVGLGKDFSGNTNYWVTNNISTTAGTTYDAMLDVPTNTSATVANYAVMNPIWAGYGTPTFSNANLTTVTTTAQTAVSTMTFPNSSKTYLEATFTAGTAPRIGIRLVTDVTQYGGWVVLSSGSIRLNDVNQQTSLATFTTNDVIGIAVDLSANTLQFYKNNVALGTANTITNSSDWVTQTQCNSGSGLTNTIAWNFGQRPFSYTPPTGFVALNTYNLPDSTIPQGNKYMDATLYTGTGSALTVTNAGGFKPDFVWSKDRTSANSHGLYDSVRGVDKRLLSNLTNAEDTSSGVSAFNSNGFSLGTAANYNTNGNSYVGWQWQAGQSSGSSNTSGSITSTVSVNTTAGFSVVTYTGNGSNSATVGHGLGVTPAMIIIKARTGGAESWCVWQQKLGASNYFLRLNATDAVYTVNTRITAQSSTTFTLGNPSNTETNGSGYTYVAYCWAEIAGFSSFGSYTGNGSADGPFVYTGFRPAFVMVKRTDAVENWAIYDDARDTYNLAGRRLLPNSSAAETADTEGLDLLSNGFKMRGTSSLFNTNGGTYIYMAFAENPFKNSNAR